MLNRLIRSKSKPARQVEIGFLAAAALTAITSLVFLSFPEIDIWFSGLFFDDGTFPLANVEELQILRSLNTWIGAAVILLSVVLLLSRPLRERFQIGLPRTLIPLVAYAVGVGLIVHTILKENVGRARPRDVLDFGGDSAFTRVWELSSACQSNCSFTSGEAAGAMAILTILAILPPLGRARIPLILGLVAIVASLSLNRVAFGAHFLSDVLLSMLIVAVVSLATTLVLNVPFSRVRSRLMARRRVFLRSVAPMATSRSALSMMAACLIPVLGAGCAAVPLEKGGSLTSYEGLVSNKGRITKAEYKVSASELTSARTVFIEPTAIAPNAVSSLRDASKPGLVANAVGRALCFGVSDRYEVVDNREDADIIISSTLTRIVRTNPQVAGLSTVTSLGASAVSPVPVPRLPMGLGGLAVEAEARTRDGTQIGAMVWSKGANAITTSARMSEVGDAYSLASSFGGDFSKMLVTGKTPFKGLPKLPSGQRLRSSLGGKPKFAACERFGRSPGLKDFAASQVGLPPEWTDKRP